MPLDLVVPDLLLPVDAPPTMRELRLPALERWLVRAHTARRPEATVLELLASAYALDTPPPVAAVTLAADEGAHEGTWLRADPVHMAVGQDAVALRDAAVLDVTREEALALVAELQSLFGADGLEFRAPVPQRWYVRVPEPEVPRTTPIDDALGRNVFGLLPKGSGRLNWPSAITEAQMLLSGHEVNRRREESGRLAINSVWFWGEGRRPESLASPYAMVNAADAFARGLAVLSGARLAARPPNPGAIDAVGAGDTALVVLDVLTQPLRRGDMEAWKQAALRLDDEWFVSLGALIPRFDSVRLILPNGRDTVVANLTSDSRWRWYRRRKPLSAHA